MQKLFEHQRRFLDKKIDKTALVWSCGTAKTRTAIEWSKQDPGKVLVVCPKALRANWERELKQWGGVAKVITKENFRARHEEPSLAGYKQIIVDEIHSGFLTPQFKSLMSKALRKYIAKNKIERVLLLSATVYTSSPWNIYSLAFYTGHVWNYQKFNFEFFDHIRMGMRLIPVPKKGSEVKLAELTKKIASVVSLEECADVPAQVFETEYFELTDEQKRLIEADYDPLPIVRFTRANEIENGVLKGNEFAPDILEIPSLKNERIYSLCQENKKVIVVCRYNLQIDYLKEFLASLKKPIFIIRGDVKDRDAVVQQAEKESEAIVLVQAACSAGYELPSFRLMVFASMDYSWVNYTQICGRILRLNNLQKNVYIHLLSGEISQAIFEAIKNKENFDIELYAKQKRPIPQRIST